MIDVESSGWSGEGSFTQVLVDHLRSVAEVRLLRVEDAPASRSEADYNFISNEIFVRFVLSYATPEADVRKFLALIKELQA
jgi:threonine aldolase